MLFLWAFGSIAALMGLSVVNAGLFLMFQLVFLTFWDNSVWQKKYPYGQITILVAVFFLASFAITPGVW